MRINKFVIAAAIGIAVIIVMTIVLLIVQNRTTPPTQNWSTQKTNEYTVSYPKDWKFQPGSIAGGGGSFNKIIPLADSSEKPVIIIQATSTGSASAEQMEEILKIIEYKNEPIVVDGLLTTLYYGKLPAIPSKPQPKQKLSFVLQKNNTVYLVEFSYQSDQPIESWEQTFTEFYSKLQFD